MSKIKKRPSWSKNFHIWFWSLYWQDDSVVWGDDVLSPCHRSRSAAIVGIFPDDLLDQPDGTGFLGGTGGFPFVGGGGGGCCAPGHWIGVSMDPSLFDEHQRRAAEVGLMLVALEALLGRGALDGAARRGTTPAVRTSDDAYDLFGQMHLARDPALVKRGEPPIPTFPVLPSGHGRTSMIGRCDHQGMTRFHAVSPFRRRRQGSP
ncbi:MAG TPA: hypothetical protein VJA27_02535 [Patescibacteria group bacterium]|nr:hypothetical protein [Patescibacteria group bacterium]